ncbi:unnamed protein product [Cylicocyclus nassatus]|uniref:Tyrosine-protein kinase n=1 Tax=Cylicocyclus nassatus TaxID=53992 RepID=A0AA36GE02_CYLNA|nr:unnamed protein product [Cylicocyclus nassatus]
MVDSIDHRVDIANLREEDRQALEKGYDERGRIYITKIRDSEAGGLHSVKHEDYFHGFMPKEQTIDLVIKVGDFLVRQAVRAEAKSFAAEHFIITVRKREQSRDMLIERKDKTEEEIEEERRTRDENELRHIPIKYSRRAKLYYVRLFGFTLVSGLIEYHRRNHIPLDEDGTIIKRAVKRADWQLNHEQIVKTKKLGDGAFGDVYKGLLRCGLIESKEVAIKTILGTISTEENEKLFREAMLMKRLVHPNVVMLIGVASNEEPVMIVMEFAPGGSVLDAVQGKPGPSIYIRIKYCHGAALGLQYLSSQGIIHRDVAARNCLIGKNDVAKISDFGLSIVGTQKKEKALKKVPVRYLAPETLKQREYTVKTDVWSFGVFMWEVFHDGKEPYAEKNAKEVRKYVLSGNTLENESDHYPQHMWSITVSCFASDPQSRPNFDSIAAQIWTGIDEFKERQSMLKALKFW